MSSKQGKDLLDKALDRVQSIPEHLQDTALKYLLLQQQEESLPEASSGPGSTVGTPSTSSKEGSVRHLREFITSKQPKGAVEEIPCLVYWGLEYNHQDSVDENALGSLYSMAHVRPPKNIDQAMRDLSSKQRGYKRLEPMPGKKGFYRLSHLGKVFVEFDVAGSKTKH